MLERERKIDPRRFENYLLSEIDLQNRLDAFTPLLTEKEFETLCLRLSGLTQSEIAAVRGLSKESVSQQMKAIRKKAATVFDPESIQERKHELPRLATRGTIYQNNR